MWAWFFWGSAPSFSPGRGRILSAPACGGSGPERSFGTKGAPASGGRGSCLAPAPPRDARRPLRLAGSAPPPRGGGGILIPTLKTCERLLLDVREERHELSPLCPEVGGACPREGVTSRAPAGRPARSDGTKRPTRIPAGLETGARAFGKSPRAGGSRLSHTLRNHAGRQSPAARTPLIPPRWKPVELHPFPPHSMGRCPRSGRRGRRSR